MKKKFKVNEIDCANCALKIEDGIKKIDGCVDANVNFMTQKITIEAEDDVFDAVVAEAAKVMDKIEPGTKFVK